MGNSKYEADGDHRTSGPGLGMLPAAAFDTWLAQDRRFVGDLLWFQARLLARAPRGPDC